MTRNAVNVVFYNISVVVGGIAPGLVVVPEHHGHQIRGDSREVTLSPKAQIVALGAADCAADNGDSIVPAAFAQQFFQHLRVAFSICIAEHGAGSYGVAEAEHGHWLFGREFPQHHIQTLPLRHSLAWGEVRLKLQMV